MHATVQKWNRSLLALVVVAALPLVGSAVTVDVTKAQQRYPWNGLVDIDYTITRSGGESALTDTVHSIEFSVVNCDVSPAVTNVAHVFLQGFPPVSDGTHRVTWNANAEGVNFKAQSVKVFASVIHYAEKYMVIDVSGGKSATSFPVSFLSGAPADGFLNDTYRCTNIVLRFIPPGSFVMGSPTTESGRDSLNEVQRPVAITKPFYIGVFLVTAMQYAFVMEDNPAATQNPQLPRVKASYDTIRGTASTSKNQYNWPHDPDVASDSFMGVLRAKCKGWNESSQAYDKDLSGLFDLPTETQWEYACRARTTTPFYGPNPQDLGRCAENKSDKKGGSAYDNGPTVVGSYLPNGWGLYDMHGNVSDWCRDWFQADLENLDNQVLDPPGPEKGSQRVTRGSNYNQTYTKCRSAYRTSFGAGTASAAIGFRIVFELP